VRKEELKMKKVFALLTVVLVTVLGCAPGGAPAPTEVAPTSTSTFVQPTPSYSVEVTKDVEYLTLLEPDAPVQMLDVYAPTEPGPWPVVLVLHAWFQSKENSAYTSFGEELAGRGVVVFVPGRRSPCSLLSECAGDNGRDLREVHESWACAVRFARERAADYGGDAGRITVFGHESSGLETALLGDDVQQVWDEFASNRGGPPPQAECLAVEDSAYVDAYIGYYGDYDFYERLKESDPDLWKLTSFFGVIGRNQGVQVYLVQGGMANPSYIERSVLLHEALVDAGYDATQMLLGEAREAIPWSGPDREELIQLIVEVARG
jgi:acetyl esterase/lipase